MVATMNSRSNKVQAAGRAQKAAGFRLFESSGALHSPVPVVGCNRWFFSGHASTMARVMVDRARHRLRDGETGGGGTEWKAE